MSILDSRCFLYQLFILILFTTKVEKYKFNQAYKNHATLLIYKYLEVILV